MIIFVCCRYRERGGGPTEEGKGGVRDRINNLNCECKRMRVGVTEEGKKIDENCQPKWVM